MNAIVAIGGASCSGKSTLTNWISYLLKVPIIHQDRFYKSDKDIPLNNGLMDWDSPEAIDFINFNQCLEKARTQGIDTQYVGPNRPVLDHSLLELTQEIKALVENIKFLVGQSLVLVDGFCPSLS